MLFALAVIVGIIIITEGTRKVPVQYAKRVVGRKMYGGQSTHIPLKVNQAGVIPIIFASSLLQVPATIAYMVPNSGYAKFIDKYFSTSGNPGFWIYFVFEIILIIVVLIGLVIVFKQQISGIVESVFQTITEEKNAVTGG